MIWLTWRQARTRTLSALGALTVTAVALGVLGFWLREELPFWRDGDSGYSPPLHLASLAMLAVPALIGVFWGAPLAARELETGTYRLVWSQSVSRVHWLAVKLGVVGALTLVVTGAFAAMLTWAAHPWDVTVGDRFGAVEFASRGVAPLGHAAFAFVLGVTAGLLIRRTVPAMAVTLAIFAVVQAGMPFVRPYLLVPVVETIAFDADAAKSKQLSFRETRDDGLWVAGVLPPDASLTGDYVQLVHQDGSAPEYGTVRACSDGGTLECLDDLGLVFTVTYQPADRYWSIQWMELGVFGVLAALTAGVAFRRVRRVS
jgi:hypothetical protein